MTKLKNGMFSDLLPDFLGSETEIKALAYALSRQTAKICDFSDKSMVYANLDNISEDILDALAAELRTPAYKSDYPVSLKKSLITDTLPYFMEMGTQEAVERIIRAIFGEGFVKMWHQYGGKPYHFRAYTNNLSVTMEDMRKFGEILATVKRLSAWLDGVISQTKTETKVVVHSHVVQRYTMRIAPYKNNEVI